MKRHEFRAEIQDRADDLLGRVAGKHVVNQWLNLAVRHIVKSYPWSFAVKTTEISTEAGTETIAMPADFQRPLTLLNTTTGYKLRPRPFQWMTRAYPDTDTTGEPFYYTHGGLTQAVQTDKPTHKLLLRPVPDAVYPIKTTYLWLPPSMTNDQHYSPLPEDFDEVIILWALVRYFRKLEDHAAASTHEANFQSELAGLHVTYGSQWQVDEFNVVTDIDELW